MTSKKYIQTFLLIISIYMGYHTLVWYTLTSQIFKQKDSTSVGDLGRMSYQIELLHKRKLSYTLKKSHLHNLNYKNQQVDIITIGDSFSNGAAKGENPYYQDFLATSLNLNILNIQESLPYNSLETIIGLYNDGFLEKLKPKVIILESVERCLVKRFAKNIDINIQNVKFKPQNKTTKIKHQKIGVVNTANYKTPYYFIMYKFNNNAKNSVLKFNLNKSLFSIGDGKTTLMYKDDINVLKEFTPKNINNINKNLNKVSKILKKIGIELIFMPAPDKYDLYYDYIINNNYPKNNFFKLFRPLKKDYVFIDTKKILSPMLKDGVKDLYWVDDTHWTQKASKRISEEYINKIYHQ